MSVSNPAKGGPWSLHALACRVAELELDPAERWPLRIAREVWWQGRVEKAEDGHWTVDFPTMPVGKRIDNGLAELRRGREKAIANETELEPKLKGVQTRLTPLEQRFRAGGPMVFRLELINDGPARLLYERSGVGVNMSFTVKTSQGQPSKYTGPPTQTAEGYEVIEPGQTAMLLDARDLSSEYRLTEPGRYSVQFRGGVGIAEADPHKTTPVHRAGSKVPETRPAQGRRSLRLFPSNTVEIEVVAAPVAGGPVK